MRNRSRIPLLSATVFCGVPGLIFAQIDAAAIEPAAVVHAECSLFTPRGAHFRTGGRRQFTLSAVTEEAISKGSGKRREVIPGGSRTDLFQQLESLGTIDSHLFRAMQEAGVTPAAKSDDATFARRASLDLTGRVPTYDRLIQFLNDPGSDKRARYIDELVARSEWVDKWTMYFGDLYKNTSQNNQVNRYPQGRNAFYSYIKSSLQANKPYNTMVTEMIGADGTNSWEQGELNWNVGGIVQGGPRTGQDIFDQQAVNVVGTFLGVAAFDCIMCHDGRRHLDELSLWGKTSVRVDAWRMSSFFAKTAMTATPVTTNTRYYAVADARNRADYALNTTTGNRPQRQPIGTLQNVTPEYMFGDHPKASANEDYRAALARYVTTDFQFARATVNYIWKEFFGRGLVDPVDQFDLARLDPDNPPPAPWSLQPSNPRLLNALARDFIDSGYDLRALMRTIVNSEAYQLSAQYDGAWNAEWEPLLARKFVRRLWAEEVADAIAQTSNLPFTYPVNGADPVRWAMQLPDTKDLPGPRSAMGSFLNSFLRGNRVDSQRQSDGSIPQTLNLMNDTFVHQRTRASGTGPSASLARQLLNNYTAANNDALIQEMFLTVLSRTPSADESQTARASLATATTAALRQQRVEDLLWALYNKVDFLFVY
jgi:hypothetical protein